MATLVLSTVGTALGGPVGSAIGALIGQSIDQQLLAPASRGPRVGDLAVQTSSYGTQIPRIYGSMRVAGTVIWSTDLIEGSETTGAKGQPDVLYSYSVSFAVALASRTASAVGRIWADGKLLRGAAGDFKVSTGFRFYSGSEDQPVDPLIASIEGLAATPAFRGLAIAVFENLELAEFGNRIPFLTFEVIADGTAPTVSAVLTDMSDGSIACASPANVAGYAAYGSSIGSAAEPLIACLGLDLFDDGAMLRSPGEPVTAMPGESDFGCSPDHRPAPRLQREQLPARAVPCELRLSYYDPARDFQAGEARASAGGAGGKERVQDFPAVLTAGEAKALAHEMLARQWARRDKLVVRLPPKCAPIEPGSRLTLPFTPSAWVVEKATIEAFVAILELRPAEVSGTAIPADAGRLVAPADEVQGEVSLALFDIPDPSGRVPTDPMLWLAASSSGGTWKRRRVEVRFADRVHSVATAARKSVLGTAITALPAGEAFLIDEVAVLNVDLVDADQWLTSCDDDALVGGANLAVVGEEIIQFGEALPIAPGCFRLSRLLRGRMGTEWACSGHRAGEPFLLLAAGTIRAIILPDWARGSVVEASIGQSKAPCQLSAEGVRPPSPAALSVSLSAAGALQARWTRRSRNGGAWIDEVDVPLGETREEYRVAVRGSSATIERTVQLPEFDLTTAETAGCGPGPAVIEVRQVGDAGLSRPALRTIQLP